MMTHRMLMTVGVIVMLIGLSMFPGCGRGTPRVEVVDLDKVLEIFTAVNESSGQAGAAETDDDEDSAAGAVDAAFLETFAAKLNEAKIVSSRIGVSLAEDGSLRGFADANGNKRRDGSERELFKLAIDAENGRIIAMTTVEGDTYRRSHGFHGGGMLTGFFLGSMLGRQRGYYGTPGRRRPNFSAMQMSPQGYRPAAVSRAQSKVAARSARSSGGSRSFRSGK